MKKSIITTSLMLTTILANTQIVIKPQWQLLGATQDIDLDKFDQANCIDYIWKYSNTAEAGKEWELHISNSNIDIQTQYPSIESIKIGEGYWIKGNKDCTIDINTTNNDNINEIYSNEIDYKALPSSIVMKDIKGGSFTMGNNYLLGPQSNEAIEHQVTLSDYKLSESEVTNAQYVEFLNSALSDGLIKVEVSSTIGPDYKKRLIIGTEISNYANKVLYNLDGTRVMKDHDNADGDDNPFTGVIEPENPLNISYIGYDDIVNSFYIKDPHNANDFNWLDLCNYYDYGVDANTYENIIKNDFTYWDELSGWSELNPLAATSLPSKDDVSEYPVTFVRWWGAKAFADYYNVKLPSEAQWEYAAKGGNNFKYAVYDGETISDANWNQSEEHPSLGHVRAAISGKANPYGLYNLGGNAWEWLADNYQAYSSDTVKDPLIEINDSTIRSWRGGSWNYHQATLESSGRYYDEENRGNDHFGFRIAN